MCWPFWLSAGWGLRTSRGLRLQGGQDGVVANAHGTVRGADAAWPRPQEGKSTAAGALDVKSLVPHPRGLCVKRCECEACKGAQSLESSEIMHDVPHVGVLQQNL